MDGASLIDRWPIVGMSLAQLWCVLMDRCCTVDRSVTHSMSGILLDHCWGIIDYVLARW